MSTGRCMPRVGRSARKSGLVRSRCGGGCCRLRSMPVRVLGLRLPSLSGSAILSVRSEISRRPTLSWARPAVWPRELGVCVVDGVRDVGGSDAIGAELSVQERDLVAPLAGFVVAFADASVCECEALAQRGVGPALDPGRYRRRRLRYGGQPAELVAQFGLGIQP